MAIARMKKIQILAHMSAKAEVVAALREGGVLHITEPSIDPVDAARHEPSRERLRRLQSDLAKLEHVRQFLKPHAVVAKGLSKVAGAKLLVSESELRGILEGTDVEALFQRCVALEGRVRAAEAEIARKEGLAAELSHWTGLGMPVEGVVPTSRVSVGLATIAGAEVRALATELGEAASESDLIEVSRAGSNAFVAVLYLKDRETAVSPVLKRHNARWVDLSGATGPVEDAARQLLAEAEAERVRIDEIHAEAAGVAADYSSVLIVLDEAVERLAKESAEESFAATRDTFLVEGWIRGREEGPLAERLALVSPAIEIRSRAPVPGEDVPIEFDNKSLVKPCEFVVTMYGRPAYWEWDPTPLIAPFFILFFGLCVGDVIYGAAIALAALYFISRMPKGSGARVTLQLLVMGGITAVVVGALTGSWAGMNLASMPVFIQRMMVLDPMADPMAMLNIVFLCGIIHILFGLGIKMAAEFKEGRWVDALLDEILWMVMIVVLVPLGFKYIFGGTVSEGVLAVCRPAALVLVAGAGLTGGRKNKNPVLKVIGGIPKLYGIVNYFADVLSYARLLALGLATGAIAMAINGVADMASGMAIVGPVVMVLVLLGGHLFNCVINILGAFVHPARLQYLEFFGKFYTGGGKAFTPFRVERRYSAVQK